MSSLNDYKENLEMCLGFLKCCEKTMGYPSHLIHQDTRNTIWDTAQSFHTSSITNPDNSEIQEKCNYGVQQLFKCTFEMVELFMTERIQNLTSANVNALEIKQAILFLTLAVKRKEYSFSMCDELQEVIRMVSSPKYFQCQHPVHKMYRKRVASMFLKNVQNALNSKINHATSTP